jgi:protoheme ferro-lyase
VLKDVPIDRFSFKDTFLGISSPSLIINEMIQQILLEKLDRFLVDWAFRYPLPTYTDL